MEFPSINEEKFEVVLHYIINETGGLSTVGKTVLFKMLYFSDFDFYELNEKFMTGEFYRKLPHGPAPAHFDKATNKLKREGKIRQFNITFGKKTQTKFVSLMPPNLESVSAKEIELIDAVICRLASMTATQISNYSHGDMPWMATKNLQPIDYELVFYRNPVYSVRSYDED